LHHNCRKKGIGFVFAFLDWELFFNPIAKENHHLLTIFVQSEKTGNDCSACCQTDEHSPVMGLFLMDIFNRGSACRVTR